MKFQIVSVTVYDQPFSKEYGPLTSLFRPRVSFVNELGLVLRVFAVGPLFGKPVNLDWQNSSESQCSEWGP
jgi:hypothetical protein